MEEKQKAVKYLAEEFVVSEAIALVALDHARGSIPQAKELLSNEMARRLIYREVREYGLESGF